MRKWKRRFQTAWKVLTGEQCLLADATQKIVYVQNSGPDGKIVQLVPWRDQILALDNTGAIWIIDNTYGSSFFQIQHVMESPRRR